MKKFSFMSLLFCTGFMMFMLGGALHAEEIKRQAGKEITVYKTPTCGCCAAWVDYMQDNGFKVTAHNLDNLSKVKTENGLTDTRLYSCHTAIVDGYVIEGHVPADDVWRLLQNKPDVTGLTAPGMPQMSPGMASIIPKGYDVLSWDQQGKIKLFSRY